MSKPNVSSLRVNVKRTHDKPGIDRPWAKRHESAMLIFKIFRRPEWDHYRAKGETLGAPVDLA
ncbi:MAG: hypothetical protein WBC95_16520, partial [Albidovulum sp.]